MELQQAQQQHFRNSVSAMTTDIAALRREVAQLQAAHEETKAGVTSIIDSRCKEIYGQLGDVGDMAGKHGRDQEVVKVQIEQLRCAFDAFEKKFGLEGELHVEGLTQHRAMLDAKHRDLHEYVGKIAGQLNDITDKHNQHSEDFEAHSSFVRDSFSKHAQELASTRAKSDHLMNQLSEHRAGRDRDSAMTDELKKAHGKLADQASASYDRCMKLEDRLNHVHGLVDTSSSDHGRRIDLAHKHLQDIHDSFKSDQQMHQARYSSMEDRLKGIEAASGDSVGKSELDAAHRKLWDIAGGLKNEQSARESHVASIDSRLQQIEYSVKDAIGKRDLQISDIAASHAHLRDICSSFDNSRYTHETQQAVLEERMKGMEKTVADALTDHSRELQLSKKQIQTLQARQDAEQQVRDSTARNAATHPGALASFESRFGKHPAAAVKRSKMDLDQIPEHATSLLDQTLAAPSLGGADAGIPDTTNWDSDYFRHVSRLIVKDDVADSYGVPGRYSTSPKAKVSLSRVASLPALSPSMLGPLA